jgi:hygromycin-B 4-O-kinase
MTKPTLAPTVILQWLQERIGAVTDFHRLTEGQESQAFGYRHDGQDYVVRVNPTATGFRKDRFAHDRFATVDLPIPPVLVVDQLDAQHAACITRRLPGTTLQACDTDTVTRLTGPVDATLAAIAAADLTTTIGFGPFDPTGNAPYPSWRAFLLAARHRHRKPGRARVDQALIDRLLNVLGRLVDACPERRHLVHGDFGSNNVLTDGHRITGVLDWANALFGDPLYDVANVLFWAPWLECMRIQAAHLRATLPPDPDLEARLRCYQVHIALAELFASNDAADDLTRWLTDRALALLDHNT